MLSPDDRDGLSGLLRLEEDNVFGWSVYFLIRVLGSLFRGPYQP